MTSLQCIKYRTDQHDDLKKIERLNNLFVRQMAGTLSDFFFIIDLIIVYYSKPC